MIRNHAVRVPEGNFAIVLFGSRVFRSRPGGQKPEILHGFTQKIVHVLSFCLRIQCRAAGEVPLNIKIDRLATHTPRTKLSNC